MKGFVFYDARGRRWSWVKRGLFVLGVMAFLAVVVFIHSLLVQPRLRLPRTVLNLRSQLQGLQTRKAPALFFPKFQNFELRHSHGGNRIRESRRIPVSPAKEILLGFYIHDNRGSLVSLKKAAPNLTHLSPEWFHLKNEECEIEIRDQPEVDSIAAEHHLKMVPLLTNFYQGWRGDLIEALVTGPREKREAFIQLVVSKLKARGDAGITVDFEEVDPEYSNAFNSFLISFAEACHRENLLFLVCVPVGLDVMSFDLDRLSKHADYFVAMLYDENSRQDPAGPIASQSWFERWLNRLLEFGQPHQWIIGLGAYGYDWVQGNPVGSETSFGDIMAVAANLGSPHVEWSKPEANPTFSYKEGKEVHTTWFLDAVTALNQAWVARKAGVAGVSVWRLGLEDPRIWDALRFSSEPVLSPEQVLSLGSLYPPDHITHIGEGEIVRITERNQSGLRVLKKEDHGGFSCSYRSFPVDMVMEHYGAVDSGQIALTFDDGPDKEWTPKILDILKEARVHATFFVVGENVEKHPEIIQRILREGHEIGNHSYTHPDLAATSSMQVDLELNATQRLLESLMGRSTVLFRPPFHADSRPMIRSEALSILRAQKLGYVCICENIDPEDWSQPGAETILKRIKEQRGDGSIILLHDAGGDRSETVEALPRIIRWLRESEGGNSQFVTVSQLLDLPRDEVMPPVPTAELKAITTSSMGLSALHELEEMLWTFMIVASVLVLVRSMLIVVLAMAQKRRLVQQKRVSASPRTFPSVSVLIAAYNEEKVLLQTVQSALQTGYPGEFELLIMDDGSADRTSEIIRESFQGEARVRLFRQINQGKSSALSSLLARANHSIIITLDADTALGKGAIEELVLPFLEDEKIGAVSGNARVGNRGRLLTEFQAIEYICGFNLDRRAYDVLNCITVVPGAVGAYRRGAIEKAGGFTQETLAEDTDLTLKIRKEGWHIAYAENAVGWTESPETLAALTRQRFRWAFGTLQCLWKHRDALFTARYGALGWFALPSMWFFQFGLVAASPLVDFLMIISIFAGNGGEVALYFAAFVLSDVILAMVALRLEGQNLWRSFWVLPQRFLYRPLLCFVVWKAIRRAMKGALVDWMKTDRTSSVKSRMVGAEIMAK